MNEFSVYIVDDDKIIRKAIEKKLSQLHTTKSFANAEDVISTIRKEKPDLVLLDIGLPGISGIEALEQIKKIDPGITVIMISAYEEVDMVIAAMKAGAYDYVTKPIHIDALYNTIKNTLDAIHLQKELITTKQKHINANMPNIIGTSTKYGAVLEFVEKAAQTSDAPVLITGESGTGKELIARSIHYKSPNALGSFVAINCASIPENLIESELFGYEKGAFSGADPGGKKGLIEQAKGGTLFLDEIGDLSFDVQAKLLRFLESWTFYKVGGTKEIKAKVRIVSATNRNLQEMIQQEKFRLDLYYRIGVLEVNIPALRERQEDILPLAVHYLKDIGKTTGRSFKGFSDRAIQKLEQHPWSGNVRELKNLVERGVIFGSPPLMEPEDMGLDKSQIVGPSPDLFLEPDQFPKLSDKGIDLEGLEKHLLQEAIRLADGNRNKAAQLLGLSYYTFRYRIKKLLKENKNESLSDDT